jgi:hypothetical protein
MMQNRSEKIETPVAELTEMDLEIVAAGKRDDDDHDHKHKGKGGKRRR